MNERSIYINGLSIGTGGGYTVGLELFRHLALARPSWQVTLGLLKGHPLHEELSRESLPDNCRLMWSPESARGLTARRSYERRELAAAIRTRGHDAALQLNGMVIPGLKKPTLAHFQDPYPFRPEAWTTIRDHVVCAFKRRAARYALKNAAACGWTSTYLRDLICGRTGVEPNRSTVFYNGVPDPWIERAAAGFTSWSERPLKMVTVSNVSRYKRQSLVIEALAKLREHPDLSGLEYHVLGACTDSYRSELQQLANRCGVGDAVHIEGRVSSERITEALSQARVMPLMSVCESFGIPPIEAMTFGTPVVVADCCALPEVCRDAALLVREDDLSHLVDRLREVLTSPDLANSLREKGARRVQDFRWVDIAEKMAVVLDEIAG